MGAIFSGMCQVVALLRVDHGVSLDYTGSYAIGGE